MSYLVRNYLFAYHKVWWNEMKKTKRRVLLHVASSKRIKTILNIAGLCAAEVIDHKSNIRYCCCGKVILFNVTTGLEIIGYVLKENLFCWTLQMEDNQEFEILPPRYEDDNVGWLFPNQIINDDPYTVISYSPIRLLISEAGMLTYTMNRFVYSLSYSNEMIIIPTQCS